jgi:transcriptional enhancer factor
MQAPKEDELIWAERGMEVVRISPQARYIMEIDPTVAFASPCLINAVSVFSVYLDDELVYSEDSPLEAVSALAPSEGTYLYSTRLLPGYWGKLCQMNGKLSPPVPCPYPLIKSPVDLSRHTVVHRVVEEQPSGTPTSLSSKILFSTMYRFTYSSPNIPLFPSAFDGCSDLLSTPQQKSPALHLDLSSSPFDSMLHMPSPEVYYEKPQQYYDITSWNNGTNIAPYSH